MGKFRLEKVGKEAQADIEKGFQSYRKDVGVMDDKKDAEASAKSIAKLYKNDVTIVVWEKRDGKWVNHLEIKGESEEDKHDKPAEKPKKEKVAKLKIAKSPRADKKKATV